MAFSEAGLGPTGFEPTKMTGSADLGTCRPF